MKLNDMLKNSSITSWLLFSVSSSMKIRSLGNKIFLTTHSWQKQNVFVLSRGGVSQGDFIKCNGQTDGQADRFLITLNISG